MGRVVVAVPHGQHPTLGEWREGGGCLGGISGWVPGSALGALNPLRGTREGAFGCWRTIPFAHLFAAGFFCMAPQLICSGTQGSDKFPFQHSREMLWLLPGAKEAPSWEVVRYACLLWGTAGFGAARGGGAGIVKPIPSHFHFAAT